MIKPDPWAEPLPISTEDLYLQWRKLLAPNQSFRQLLRPVSNARIKKKNPVTLI